ncbi:MAG: ketopantoate reductase family protein [Clostridiales bacterium]|nr:ketopantoate reductase family protein [Clostridiales bacterium]
MIKTIGVVGAGSVGSSLIYAMYQKDPDNVYLIATGTRATRLSSKGISVNNHVFFPKIYSNPYQNINLDLIILAVKTYSLEAVISDIKPLITNNTIILPIENGITATTRLRESFPDNRVLYGIVLRTDAHRMGRRVFVNTMGEMQIGYADNTIIASEVQDVYTRLKELGINIHIYQDMLKTQWRKWMLNTGASQAAVEVQAECGFFGQVKEIRDLMQMLMDEILAIGQAEGVNITTEDRDEIIEMLINFPPDKKMSMLQDYEAGRPIEIDEYAGVVIRLGEKHGIPTPANKILYLTITARQKIDEMRKH